MEARTRDLLFGVQRTHEDLRGTFAPRGWGAAGHEKGAILATFKGIGPNGWGRDHGLAAAERFGLITAEQRAAGGPVGAAAAGAAETGEVRHLVSGAGAAIDGTADLAPRYADPVYGGLYAQQLMAQNGFVPPLAETPTDAAGDAVRTFVDDAADPVAAAADDADSTIAAAADDAVDEIVELEQRLLASFERLGQLPADQKVPALARAVDATAAAGHGGDAFDVLAESLARRPLGDAADALDGAVAQAVTTDYDKSLIVVGPNGDRIVRKMADGRDAIINIGPAPASVSDEVTKTIAPVVDDAADLVARSMPQVVEAAVPAIAHAASSRSLLLGSDDALRGVMSFADGIDDTLRLLGKL